jgi:hypothetical protein
MPKGARQMVVLVIVAFIILYLIRLPALRKPGYRRDLIVFSALMAVDFAFSFLLALEVKFPFIGTEITKFFKAYILK